MWEFLLTHPIWGFVYLVTICLTIMVCVGKLTPWLGVVDGDDEQADKTIGHDAPRKDLN